MDSEDDMPEVAELGGAHLKQCSGLLGPMNECQCEHEYTADGQVKKGVTAFSNQGFEICGVSLVTTAASD